MALIDFSTDQLVVTVNGRIMSNWGTQDPPYSDEPIDATSEVRRGLGGGSTRFNRTLPGRRVNLYFLPGSEDSGYMQGLFNSNANMTVTFTVIGTLENAIGTNGAIVNDGSRGRGGASISDDQFILEFANWTGLRG